MNGDFFDNVEIDLDVPEDEKKLMHDWQFAAFCEFIHNKEEDLGDDFIKRAAKIVNKRLSVLLFDKNTDIDYEVSVYNSDQSVTSICLSSNIVVCVKVLFSGIFGSVQTLIKFFKCLNVFDGIIDFVSEQQGISYGLINIKGGDKITYNHKFSTSRYVFGLKLPYFRNTADIGFFFMGDMYQIAECCNYLMKHNSLLNKTENGSQPVTSNAVKHAMNFFDSSDEMSIFNNMRTLVITTGLYHPGLEWVVFDNPSEDDLYKEKYGFDFCDKIMFRSLCGLENVVQNKDLKVSVSRIDAASVNKYDPAKDVSMDYTKIKEWFAMQIPFSKKRWMNAIYRIDPIKDIAVAGFNCGHSYNPETDKYYINTIAICGQTEIIINAIKTIFNG